jgi:integrase
LVPPPKIPNALKGRALTPAEVRYLLVGPDRSTPREREDYALMLVMLRLSVRVSELGRIKRSSMQWNGGRWTLTLKVKGGAEEIWPLPPEVKEAIDHYLRLDEPRRSHWPENRTEGSIRLPAVAQPPDGQTQSRADAPDDRADRAQVGGLYGGEGNRHAARLAPDGHHTRAQSGAHLPRGADDVEAQRPEDRHALRLRRDNLERNPVNTLSYEDN